MTITSNHSRYKQRLSLTASVLSAHGDRCVFPPTPAASEPIYLDYPCVCSCKHACDAHTGFARSRAGIWRSRARAQPGCSREHGVHSCLPQGALYYTSAVLYKWGLSLKPYIPMLQYPIYVMTRTNHNCRDIPAVTCLLHTQPLFLDTDIPLSLALNLSRSVLGELQLLARILC